MPRAYVYEPKNIKTLLKRQFGGGANWQNIPISQAKNTTVRETSALEGLGKGAAIGGTAGSVVPGIGNAVGTAIGAAIGAGYGVFTHDERQTRIRNVLPIVLKSVMLKRGAQATYGHKHSGKRGKGGLKVTGKAFRPQKMLEVVKDMNNQLAKSGSKHKPKHAAAYNQFLKVSTTPPPTEEQIIVSFPVLETSEEATARAQSTPPSTTESTNAQIAVYGLGALAAAWYAFG